MFYLESGNQRPRVRLNSLEFLAKENVALTTLFIYLSIIP